MTKNSKSRDKKMVTRIARRRQKGLALYDDKMIGRHARATYYSATGFKVLKRPLIEDEAFVEDLDAL